MSLALLDKSIPEIRKALPKLDLDEAEKLLAAEQNGKTRKGVMALLGEYIAGFACEEPPVEGADVAAEETPEVNDAARPDLSDTVIESLVEGGTLHLGDGRRLAFGERAAVSSDLALMLRERGQAK